MFFEDLNSVVEYIENHLKENINIKKLAQMLGTNQDTFKRIFSLICGVSVADYIKKRRLTICCADLKTRSVLEIAFSYGYSSSAGFSRAFYGFHKCFPSDIKQNVSVSLNAFLPIKISTNCGLKEINYCIENWGKQEFFGYALESDVHSLQQVVGKEYANFLQKYNPNDYYGITFYEKNGKAKYYFCLKTSQDGMEKVEIPAGQWLVLEYSGKFSDISKFVRAVYQDIGKKINYLPNGKIDMELYSNGKLKLCFLLK